MDRYGRIQRVTGQAGREFVRGGSGRPGFSLVELLVVLLVVSILSVLIVPNIEIVKYRMDGAARGVVAALVSAQRQAVVRQHDVIVAFDTDYRGLRIHQDRNNDGQLDDGEPVRPVPFDDGVVYGLGGAPALFDADIVGFQDTQAGLPIARFTRSGSAGEEGHIYLTSTRTADTGLYPKDTRAVKVDRATGRVTWYYYDPDQWKKGF
ncbi:MAG: GspH/FimT family protein [Longimicrobiales bacterium]